MMTDEMMLDKIDKLHYRLQLYVKKMNTMGLEEIELNKYYSMLAEYIQLKLLLNDALFNNYVLPMILHDDALNYYKEIECKLKWKTELLIKQEQMDKVVEKFLSIENKEAVIKTLKKYHLILLRNLKECRNDIENHELFEEICLLLSDDQDSSFNVMIDQIDRKFEILYLVLNSEVEQNETIKKTS